MIKSIFSFMLVSLMTASLLYARPVEDKEAFFEKLAEGYSCLEEVRGDIEIGMDMMGTELTVPMKFWTKPGKMRMDMKMTVPGMSVPMEQIMVIDSQRMLQYHKMMNTVMTADLTSMPSEIAEKISMTHSSMLGRPDSVSELKEMEDSIDVEERSRDGKKFYLITIRDLDKLGDFSSMGGVNSPNVFGRLLLWIDYDLVVPVRVEFFGEAESPGMWVDFKEIKIEEIPDEVFNPVFPADVKHVDITDMIQGMYEMMD